MPNQPLIGLLDCNNFFVSCERLFRPDLINKPVVVLSSNDGCIVARSQEVKDAGITMGVPYFQIKDLLEEIGATVFSSHFALYRDISRRVFSVMREELSVVEQYSVDEAFFKVTDEPNAVASRVKKSVERQIGIPVSVGIAPTKTQAKYANLLAKKETGISVVDTEKWLTLSSDIPLSAIWGVGGKFHLRMKQHNLQNVYDLMMADPALIANVFGVIGTRLQKELSGTQVFPLLCRSHTEQKSIMHSKSFPQAVYDSAILADAISYHVRHVAAELRASGKHASSLRVSIQPSRHGNHILFGGSKDVTLSAPTSDTMELLQVAQTILQELYEPGVPYKKAGIIVSGLQSSEQIQQTLFGGEERKKSSHELLTTIDYLNKKAGRELVTIGSRLKENTWQPKSASRSPAYTTDWKSVPKVQA